MTCKLFQGELIAVEKYKTNLKTRESAIDDCLDYLILVTQLHRVRE